MSYFLFLVLFVALLLILPMSTAVPPASLCLMSRDPDIRGFRKSPRVWFLLNDAMAALPAKSTVADIGFSPLTPGVEILSYHAPTSKKSRAVKKQLDLFVSCCAIRDTCAAWWWAPDPGTDLLRALCCAEMAVTKACPCASRSSLLVTQPPLDLSFLSTSFTEPPDAELPPGWQDVVVVDVCPPSASDSPGSSNSDPLDSDDLFDSQPPGSFTDDTPMYPPSPPVVSSTIAKRCYTPAEAKWSLATSNPPVLPSRIRLAAGMPDQNFDLRPLFNPDGYNAYVYILLIYPSPADTPARMDVARNVAAVLHKKEPARDLLTGRHPLLKIGQCTDLIGTWKDLNYKLAMYLGPDSEFFVLRDFGWVSAVIYQRLETVLQSRKLLFGADRAPAVATPCEYQRQMVPTVMSGIIELADPDSLSVVMRCFNNVVETSLSQITMSRKSREKRVSAETGARAPTRAVMHYFHPVEHDRVNRHLSVPPHFHTHAD